MSELRALPGGAERHEADEARGRELLLRYTAAVRSRHWLTAIAFVLAALSGLALFHPALFPLSGLFGGGPWTRILHPYLGLLMLLAFALLAGRVWTADIRMQPRDWAWLRQFRDVGAGREERLPEVGRYNAGQKLVFYVALACLALLLLSGLVTWRAWFSADFPVGLIRLASVVHAVCALILVCTIIVHVYAAIWVKGSLRAMTSGTVTLGWAWKHHRAWFREMTTREANSRPRAD
jgi:formate dehydrogenase subunit gamma